MHAYEVTGHDQRSYTHSTEARFNPRGDKPTITEERTVSVIKLRHKEYGDFVWIPPRLSDLQHIESQLGPDSEAWTGCTLELHYRQEWEDLEPFSYTQPADPDEEPKAC